MLNCLMLEDERDAQEILAEYISKVPFLQLIGTFESGLDVESELLQRADLLFLDIQLPELNGIQYLKSLAQPPQVIVTTAYPDFALDAFEIAATDYLLKPFSFARFYKSIQRIQQQQVSSPQETTYFVYADKTTYKIKASEILFFKAEVDYVKIVTQQQELLVLDSLRNWQEKLTQSNFIRIHRSYIVNLDWVQKVSGNQLFLENQQWLPIGLTYKKAVMERFFT